jgi:hypothetical protein
MPITYVPVSVPDAATYTVRAENSGLMHYIPDLTADCVITLPSPKAGLWFEFAYSGVAADAHDWNFTTGSNTNYFLGGLLYVDDNPTSDSIAPDGNSNSKMNVLTPESGTRIRIESANGTLWVVSGVVASANAPTFADQ